MKISNTNVQYLYNWLNLQLHGQQARARNKFTGMIEKQYHASLHGRTEILKKHSDKNKKTKEPIIENGMYKMSEKVLEKAKKEVTAFLDKTTDYTFTREQKLTVLRPVVRILEEAKLPLNIEAGKIYDEVMTTLEAAAK